MFSFVFEIMTIGIIFGFFAAASVWVVAVIIKTLFNFIKK